MAVYEKVRNKKYKIDVIIAYNGDKKIRHIETFHGGKKDAVLRENEIKAQVKNHTFVSNNKMTVKDLMLEYLESNKTKWTPKNYISNQHWIDVINNQIGHIYLQNLNVKILEDFYKYLHEYVSSKTNKPYSDKTIQNYYVLINSALNKAKQWDYNKCK